VSAIRSSTVTGGLRITPAGSRTWCPPVSILSTRCGISIPFYSSRPGCASTAANPRKTPGALGLLFPAWPRGSHPQNNRERYRDFKRDSASISRSPVSNGERGGLGILSISRLKVRFLPRSPAESIIGWQCNLHRPKSARATLPISDLVPIVRPAQVTKCAPVRPTPPAALQLGK
jgi:hypothetical protein